MNDKPTLLLQELKRIQPINQHGHKALPYLMDVLNKYDDFEVQKKVIVVLGEFGEAAKPSIPELMKKLNSRSKELRMVAALSLAKIGTSSIPFLKEAMQKKKDDSSYWASIALMLLHPEKVKDEEIDLLCQVHRKTDCSFERFAAEEVIGRVITFRMKQSNKE